MDLDRNVAERRPALFRFAVILTGGKAALADADVGEVLARAVERWPQVGAADNVHAYMRKMVLNEYLSWRRRSDRVTTRGDLSDLLTPTADHATAHAEHQALVNELRRLPAKQRAAVVLRYYEGLEFVEIADLLGSGENAVRSNLSRALATLRIHLTDEAAASPRPFPLPLAEVRP